MPRGRLAEPIGMLQRKELFQPQNLHGNRELTKFFAIKVSRNYYKILQKLSGGKIVELVWIPKDSSKERNQKADLLAKNALGIDSRKQKGYPSKD
ncbi:hypothetical protein QE152_g20009 [Popillia japonica]|uniref:RNase H type-1 domain-containing protein n=1 Tax=Popillia japonica TaxID=7064 RepID=A0AAW1KPI4_POPJA